MINWSADPHAAGHAVFGDYEAFAWAGDEPSWAVYKTGQPGEPVQKGTAGHYDQAQAAAAAVLRWHASSQYGPGMVIEIPGGTRQRPYCLRIISVIGVSRVTGTADVLGHVLALNGTTRRAKPLSRRAVIFPDQAQRRPDLEAAA